MTDPAQRGSKKYCRDDESLPFRARSLTTLPREGPSMTDPLYRRRAALKIRKNVYAALNGKRKARRCNAKFGVYSAYIPREETSVMDLIWGVALCRSLYVGEQRAKILISTLTKC